MPEEPQRQQDTEVPDEVVEDLAPGAESDGVSGGATNHPGGPTDEDGGIHPLLPAV